VRDREDHGEVTAKHGAARIFNIAAKTVQDFSRVGDNARSVLADDRNGKMGLVHH
jgi:hypothetical protein